MTDKYPGDRLEMESNSDHKTNMETEQDNEQAPPRIDHVNVKEEHHQYPEYEVRKMKTEPVEDGQEDSSPPHHMHIEVKCELGDPEPEPPINNFLEPPNTLLQGALTGNYGHGYAHCSGLPYDANMQYGFGTIPQFNSGFGMLTMANMPAPDEYILGGGANEQVSQTDNANKQTEKKDQGIECKVCNKYITRSKNLKLHMRTHTGERPYECTICPSRFSNSSMLQIHIRSHTGEKPYECELCQKRFIVKSHLRRHTKTHTGEKPFQCGICQNRFINNSNLQEHYKTHTGERSFQCNICQRGFTRNTVLQRHLRTHTGEKPHECTICNKMFADKSKLQIHLRIHTGEKPFECNFCHSRFNDNYRLKVHLRTHTGEKPYECIVCQRPFADRSNLRNHLLTHSGEKKVSQATMSLIAEPLVILNDENPTEELVES